MAKGTKKADSWRSQVTREAKYAPMGLFTRSLALFAANEIGVFECLSAAAQLFDRLRLPNIKGFKRIDIFSLSAPELVQSKKAYNRCSRPADVGLQKTRVIAHDLGYLFAVFFRSRPEEHCFLPYFLE